MSLRINDLAPDFTANTTQGEMKFHEWIGDGWAKNGNSSQAGGFESRLTPPA